MKNLSEPDASASRTSEDRSTIHESKLLSVHRLLHRRKIILTHTGEPPAGMKAGLHSSIVLDGLSIGIIVSTVSYHYPVTM